MTIKGEKEYGSISFAVQGLPLANDDSSGVVPAFMELLNSSGAPVRKVTVENGMAKFIDLAPEKYYARIILDANGNGLWDAGNYEERRQPEKVFYFPQLTPLRQNWSENYTWDVSKSTLGEKPADIVKNKPKEEQRVKRDYKEESKPQRSNNSMPGIGGIRF